MLPSVLRAPLVTRVSSVPPETAHHATTTKLKSVPQTSVASRHRISHTRTHARTARHGLAYREHDISTRVKACLARLRFMRSQVRNRLRNCGATDHFAQDCPADVECFRCGQIGHFVRNCPYTAREARDLLLRDLEMLDVF